MEGKGEQRPAQFSGLEKSAYPVGEAAGAARPGEGKAKVKEEALIEALERESLRRWEEFLAENRLESAPASEWQAIQLASPERSAFQEPESPPLQPARDADPGAARSEGRDARAS